MKEELKIFRDLNESLRGLELSTAYTRIAELQDKVVTILLSSKSDLAHYLTSDDSILRELAERRYNSYES